MHCPICGQQQASENIRFCSRCGFLLTGISEVVANNGLIPNQPTEIEEVKDSPRKRGVKQGLMILLVGCFLIAPLIAMIHIGTNTDPIFMAVAIIISFFGGLLRMVYALLFESKNPSGKTLEQKVFDSTKSLMGKRQNQPALPPQQSTPVSDYVAPGSWRDTKDLVQAGSVTETTTKLLQKEEKKD